MNKDIILKLRDCKESNKIYLAKYEVKRGRKIEAKIFKRVDSINLEVYGLSWQFTTMEQAKDKVIDLLESKLNILGFNNKVVFI